MDLLVLLYFGYCVYDAYLKTRTNVAAIRAGEPVVFDNGDSFLAWSLRALLRTLWAGVQEGAHRAGDEIGRRRAAKRDAAAAGERLGWRERLWPPRPARGGDAPRLDTGRTDDPPDTDDHDTDDHRRAGGDDLPGALDDHDPGDDRDPADRDDLPGNPDDLDRRTGDDHDLRGADDHRPANVDDQASTGGDDQASAGGGRGPGRCAAGCGAPAPAGTAGAAACCAACAARRDRQQAEWLDDRLYLHATDAERGQVMLAFGAHLPVDEELWRQLRTRGSAAADPPAPEDPPAAAGEVRAEAPVFGEKARPPASAPGAGRPLSGEDAPSGRPPLEPEDYSGDLDDHGGAAPPAGGAGVPDAPDAARTTGAGQVGPCPACGAAGVVRWSTDTLTGTVECPDCRGTGRAGAKPLRATPREIEDAVDRFGRQRFTDDDLAVARGGGCTHQTRAGFPGDGLCGNPLLPGSVYCAEHVGWDDSADWGDLGVTPDEPAAAADDLGQGRHPQPTQPAPAAGGSAPADGPGGGDAAGPAAQGGPARPGRPHLTLVRWPRSDGRADAEGDGAAPGHPTAQPQPGAGLPGGTDTVTISSSGETTNISSARDYYGELGTHVEADILSQIELSESTLTAAEMGDPRVMGAITAATEQFALARDAATAVVAALETHRQMEEAVQATPGAAKTDFYREDGSA